MDIASIERDTSEVIRLGTVVVSDLGGELAVNKVLRANLLTLISVAHQELGPDNTCQLMFEGLKTAEAMADGNTGS